MSLTEEQREAVRKNAEKWRDLSYECFEVDRNEAEEGFRLYYRSLMDSPNYRKPDWIQGLKDPNDLRVAWAGSPIAACVAGPVCMIYEIFLKEVRKHSDDANCTVESLFSKALSIALEKLFSLEDAKPYADGVISSIWSVVEKLCPGVIRGMDLEPLPGKKLADTHVREKSIEEIVECFHDSIGRMYPWYNAGHTWGTYAAYLTSMRDLMNSDHDAILTRATEKVTLNSGWWWPSYTFVVASPRPVHIKMNEERTLFHSADGPAIKWPDGFAVYSYEGIRIRGKFIDDRSTLTIKEITSCTNAEVRRVLIELYGVGKYLVDSGAKVVDMDGGNPGANGAAPRVLLRDDRDDLWLVGTDGTTSRVYHMPVPAGAKTCREAHEMMAGMPEEAIFEEA